MNCKDCKYWSRISHHNYGECKKIDKHGDVAFIEYSEYGHFWLETREDFGCVLFEEVGENAK